MPVILTTSEEHDIWLRAPLDGQRRSGGRCPTVRTVPVGVIAELIRGDVFYWGQLTAGASLGSIPIALIYSFFVAQYVAGLTAGSVKA
jgi:ABC-type glycerol-3-phosphate transport system permease component